MLLSLVVVVGLWCDLLLIFCGKFVYHSLGLPLFFFSGAREGGFFIGVRIGGFFLSLRFFLLRFSVRDLLLLLLLLLAFWFESFLGFAEFSSPFPFSSSSSKAKAAKATFCIF